MPSTSNFDLTYNQQNVVAGGALSNPAATTGTSAGSGVTKILSGGSNVTLSPTSGVGDVTISVTSGGSGTVTEVKGQGSVNGITLTGDVTTSGYLTLGGTLGSIANTQLSNSTITIAGNSTALGGTVTQDQITGLSATTAGIVKHTTSANTLALATAGTDYSAGTSALATGVLKSTTTTGALSIAGGSDLNSTFGSQTAKTFYAAPNGSSGTPSFRAIAASDVPTLNQNTTGSAGSVTGLSVTSGKTLTASNTLTLAGTDGSTLNVGSGGTLGSAAYTASSSYVAASSGTANNLTLSGTLTASSSAGSSGQVLQSTGTGVQWATPSTGGNVTGSGSSTSGHFAAFNNTSATAINDTGYSPSSFISATATQTPNYVLAGPSSGSAAAPTFRAIVPSDVPTLNQSTTGSAATLTAGRTIAITGDLGYTSPAFDGSGNVTATGTLATITTAAGPIGSSTVTPVITIDAKGRVTALSSATIASGSLPSGGTQGQRLIKDYTNTVAWGNDPMIYAEDYGFFASNSASANNTALQNAINAAMTANGTLLIPPGIFSISAAMNIGSSGSPFQSRVKIAGCGKLVTEIIQTAAVDGFDVYLDSPLLYNIGIEFDGFSLIGGSTSSPSSVGININMTEPTVTAPNYPSEEFGDLIIINNIQITGYAVDPHYGWVSALMLFNPWHAVITNSFFGGSLNAIPTTSGRGSGFGVYISNGVNCKIECTTIAWFYKGIAMVTTGGSQIPETQGVQINNIQMLNTVNAIYCVQSIMYLTNFLFDNGNNINSAWETIHIEQHVGSGYITGGQILQKGGTNQIYIGNSSHGVMISNVDFTNQYTSNTRSIYVTGNSTNVVVTGCIFGSATPIQIDSGCTSVLTSANLPFTGSSNVIDNGTGNYTDWWRGKGASLNVNSSAFAISSGTATTIQWSGTSFDDGFYSSSNNTRITIPSNRGIKRVRLTLSVYWTSNSNGIRTIAIWDNSGNIYAALVTTGDFSTITTGLIDLASVSNPSYFYATGYQDSGSTLNVQSNSASSFTIQVEQ